MDSDKNRKDLPSLCLEEGFTQAVPLDVSTIELKAEVRGMCAMNTCGMYGKNWSCPPACGSLKDFEEKIRSFRTGILVQTTVKLEDAWDYEAMMLTEQQHKARFAKLEKMLRQKYTLMAMGSGCCTRCKTCSYPKAPCRFPAEAMVSMEACGMVVSEVCVRNGLRYYYGESTVSFTSCFLLKEKEVQQDKMK